MKIECPHCSQRIELDEETLAALAEIEAFECPSCGEPVPSPVKTATEPDRPPTASTEATSPNPFLKAFLRMNHTTRVLGLLALLVIGGAAIFLASRPGGDTHIKNRKIREEIIHNEFFTRLIASGATTLEDLRSVESFAAYGDGYVGLSEEAWTWDEAESLAQRTGGTILDLARTPHEGRKEMGTWLAKTFPDATGRAVWVEDQDEARGIDAPDLLASTDPKSRWRVFLSWSETSEWQNHGWSWKIEPNFDEALPFTEWGLAAVRAGTLWGLIGEDGKFALELQFDEVGKFSDQGCVRVRVGEKWGVVNRRGQLVAKPEWEDVQDQINGFTPVRREGKWGYLDDSGELAIPCEWDDAWRFSPEGFAVVTREGKRGYIERNGKIIVEPEWDGAINFSKEGLGMVRRGISWSLIDTTGRTLAPHVPETRWQYRRWDLGFIPHIHGATARDGTDILGEARDRYLVFLHPARRFSEGLALIDTETGSGFVDTFGEWSIAPTDLFCRDFHEGFAAASKEGKWGFIDRSGAVVIEPTWDEVGDFAEGRASVRRGERWGWIAGDGVVISEPVWDEVRPFREGFSAVRRDEKWGFLERSGKVIAEPAWKAVGDFSEGFASVQVEPTPEQLAKVPTFYRSFGFWSFIDTSGRLVFDNRVWFQPVYSRTAPPSFAKGIFRGQLVEGPFWNFVRMNARGELLPFRTTGETREISNGLSIHEEPTEHLYLDRHGRSEIHSVLRERDGGLVMPGVNPRSELLADRIPYAEPPKYGLIDMTGNVIVPPTWDEAKILSPDRVWIKVSGKCGLADGKGRILIEPKWDELELLEVDTGSLAEDVTTILLNRTGKPILSPWVRVREGESTRYLREDGSPAIPDKMPDATFVDFYDRDRIVIRDANEAGEVFLSLYEPATGKKQTFPAVAKMRWNWNTASLGFIWMQDKTSLRWHLRGRNGEHYDHSQPEPEKPEGWGFIEGRARLHQQGGWFHIGTDGRPISAERWEEARDFAEGRAAVKRAGKWGFIVLEGTLVTEMTYEEAHDFSRGLAAVKVEGRWGFIDPSGDLVIAAAWDEVTSPVYDGVPGFHRWFGEPGAGDPPGEAPFLDVAQVKINGAAALIGRDGGLIVDPRLPKLTREGDAYMNGEEQLIVMKRGDGARLVRRERGDRYSKRMLPGAGYDTPIVVSPAYQWQVSDEEAARVKALQDRATELQKSESPDSRVQYLQFLNSAGRWVNLEKTDWVLVDETAKVVSEGNWISPKTSRTSDPFSTGLIHARGQNEKYGLIRKDGTIVMEPRFDSINWVAPKIAAVWNRDEGGLITVDGEWLFQDNDTARIARFVRPTDTQFRHGLAVIEDVPKWGYARLNRTDASPETP